MVPHRIEPSADRSRSDAPAEMRAQKVMLIGPAKFRGPGESAAVADRDCEHRKVDHLRDPKGKSPPEAQIRPK